MVFEFPLIFLSIEINLFLPDKANTSWFHNVSGLF